jgi:glycine/D-amino acid oxidase-like deaminating enzyme
MSAGHAAEPRSYWHVTAPPPVPSDPLPDAADVVVIGGGLLGSWTAYWLARNGASVTLIERTAISWGATGRNGGFVRAGTSEGYAGTVARLGRDAAHAIWQLTEEGQALVRQVVDEEGIDCDYRTPGTLNLALTDESLAQMRQGLDVMQADGLPGALLDRQGVQELIKTPLGPEITGGLYFSDGGLLHSARYLAGIAQAAQRHGARLCLADVSGLTSTEGGTLVQTSRGVVRAGRVIVAVNAWTDELVPGLAGKVVPVRGQILSYDPLPTVFTTGVGASVAPTGEYWQQTLDGSIVIGGCRADAPHGDVGVREPVPTPDVIASIERVLPRLFPQLAGLQVAHRWAGLMAFTADYLPVADAAPDLPGVWVAGGFCGHGMPYGPRLGQLLAEAALIGTTPAKLAPLRIDRPTLVPMAAAV